MQKVHGEDSGEDSHDGENEENKDEEIASATPSVVIVPRPKTALVDAALANVELPPLCKTSLAYVQSSLWAVVDREATEPVELRTLTAVGNGEANFAAFEEESKQYFRLISIVVFISFFCALGSHRSSRGDSKLPR